MEATLNADVEGGTQAGTSVLEARRERQLVGGRYRLVAYHRGDTTTEVWRALDEETQAVVTLEFLIDQEPGTRERFLTQGRRMAAIQQPSVMRVAAINEDPSETYIVYEHLVHVPVALDSIKPPEPVLPPEPPAVLIPAAPPAPPAVEALVAAPVEQPKIEPAPAPAPEPLPVVAAEETEPTTKFSSEHGLDALLGAVRAGELALIDSALVKESAHEVYDAIRVAVADMRFDEAFADLRSSVLSFRPSSIFGLFGGAARKATALRPPKVRAPSAPQPQLAAAKPAKPPKAPKIKAPKIEMVRVESVKPAPAPRGPGRPNRILGRVRIGHVLVNGIVIGALAVVTLTMPEDVAASLFNIGTRVGGEVATQVTTVGGQVADQVSTAVGQAISGATTPALAKAPFDVPPLSSYNAAFEAQAAYPKAAANATVEWVVALRNTGSVGWYRGIDGAQASLALSDGTSAAVQSTPFVGPGQVGWFIVHFKAPAQPGTYNIALLPRIDGRGQLKDLGIFATVTVTTAP